MIDPRAVAKIVLEDGFTVAGALKRVEPGAIDATIAEYRGLTALLDAEPDLDGALSLEVRKWLKPIGMKSWPDLSPNAKTEWLSAMLLALSDLPGPVALAATRKAIHQPFRFPNEVEPKIREIAAEIMQRHRLAVHRLERMRAEIERALNPPPMIEQQPHIWTDASVEEANIAFTKLGLSFRYRRVGDDVESYDYVGDVDTVENRADKQGQEGDS